MPVMGPSKSWTPSASPSVGSRTVSSAAMNPSWKAVSSYVHAYSINEG